LFKGTNLNNPDDWMFADAYEGRVIEPGVDWSIPFNSEVVIKGVHNFQDAYYAGLTDMPRLYNAVKIHFDGTGNREITYMNSNMIEDQITLGVEDNEETNISDDDMLKQNFPNPFNSNTTISYYSKGGPVELNVFNLKGQKLETLVNGKQTQGEHKVIWDAEKYPAGIYLYQLQTPNSTQVKRMTSLK
ncbi:MAG: T9SS type A sorting domain-containing protein, partial [Planctomycetia bacterium]|nr:T9SS type A sorting domain-containing protein [Planctomycetia bacterium]